MKKYINDLAKQNDEFQEIIKPLITNETVLQMKNFRQHYETTCFDIVIQQLITAIKYVKNIT